MHVKFGMEKEHVQSCLFKYEYGYDAKIWGYIRYN
jgi:hypothetical protein